MYLLNLALAPTLIILFYVYIRDKYEKEPLRLLFYGVLYGVISSFFIIFTENFVQNFEPNLIKYSDLHNLYNAFFVASFVEEFYKYIFIYFFIWKNRHFNEPLDAIVYSVFISLGFAGIENILYVLNPQLGGFETAIARAIISVPVHALFGVFMGYQLGMAKFFGAKLGKTKAYLIPFLMHGLYDALLVSKMKFNEIFFVLFVIYLWVSSFKKLNKFVSISPFKNS